MIPFVAIGPGPDYPAVADVEQGVEYDFGNLTGTLVGGGGGSGDATLANQELILDKLDQIIADGVELAATALETNTITGFPDTLVIGDSYTSDVGRQIIVYTVDENADPITGVGSLDFADATVSFTFARDRDSTPITGSTAVFTEAANSYVTISIPSSVTSQAKPEYTYIGTVKFTWSSPAAVYTFRTAAFSFID